MQRDALLEAKSGAKAMKDAIEWAADVMDRRIDAAEEPVILQIAEDFCRLGALLFTATAWIFIPAYCFAVP